MWPSIQHEQIEEYLLHRPASDGKPTDARVSMDATNFLLSGWIGTVSSININKEQHILLKCDIRRLQTVALSHSVWVCCEKDGYVETAGCTCIAGLAKVCSHVGALLYKILHASKQNLTGCACTDIGQQWNKGTTQAVYPQKAKRLKPNETCEGSSSPKKKVLQYYSHVEYRESVENSGLKDALQLDSAFRNTLTVQIQNNPAEDLNNNPGNHPHINMFGHFTSVQDIVCPDCRDFYMSYVDVDKRVCERIEKATIDHSKNSIGEQIWIATRKIRITASTANKCPKKKETDSYRFLKEHTKTTFQGNFATRHGCSNESIARQRFEEITDLFITLAGSVICETDPWLSATPDGIIDEETIIEIKCPLLQDSDELFKSKKYDVRLDEDGEEYLHRTGRNGYFTQVQLTMHCTKRQKCIFIVYASTTQTLKCITVSYDIHFCTYLLSRLRKFYFDLFLPYITNLHQTNNLGLHKSYASICYEKKD